ncbi:Hsp70 family protein [Streptomyces sp. NBC_01102]|uniref:Hsp70 family protein n=1 Tax=Streptomyces sp. NBC_01102 TaxID=2903749 RepID=UPI00386C897C|nr:Hsp70 family protein [Streptomyces sp. NBC_01102]
MIAIDLGHRFGRIGRIGPDGRPDVTATELEGTDGVLDPGRALPQLFGPAPDGSAAAAAEPDRTVVLGVPASGGREDELRRAAESAGLDVERVVPAPVAVALHYGAVAEGVDHTVLVCDQGARTLDLSVLAIAPDLTVHVVRTHSLPIGGDDWDAAIAAELAGRVPDGVDPRRAAGLLRLSLGTSDSVTESVSDAEGGRHALTLDRATFERAVAPLRERALAAVTEQLSTAEPAVGAVLLAGGLCAMPGRRAEIEGMPAAQGLTVRCRFPELAVIRGLLELRDFGVLRVITGPAPRQVRADAGYGGADAGYGGAAGGHPRADVGDVRTDPLPPDSVTDPDPDPDPRTGHAPEDPDPETRPDDTPTATDARHQDAAADPGKAAPHTEAPHTGGGPTTVPGPRRTPEPPPPSAPEAGPAPGRAPGRASEPASEEPAPEPPEQSAPASDDTAAPRPSQPSADPQARFAVPVGELQAIRRGGHLLVLWAWPDGALTARVRWRREGGSAGQGPDDGDVVCRRRVYEHDGGFDLAVGRGAVTVTVEALVADLGRDCEGASSLLVPTEPPVVEYEPTVRRRLRGRTASVTFTSRTACDLPGLHLVHSLGRFRPTSTAEGTVLHEVPAQRLSAGTPLTVEFPLPPTRGPSWLVCFPADANAGTDSGIDIRPTALHRLRVT